MKRRLLLVLPLLASACCLNGNQAPATVTGLIVHRGVPLLDLSGHGWNTIEDYVWAEANGDVSLYQLRFSVEPMVERLWPGRMAEVKGKLALGTKESLERKAHVITYTVPDTEEYRKLGEATRKSVRELVVTVDGREALLADKLLLHSTHAYAFVTTPRRQLKLNVSRGTDSFSAVLPDGEPHVAVRHEGRLIPDFVGVAVIDAESVPRSVYRNLSPTDQTLFCLHPPPRE